MSEMTSLRQWLAFSVHYALFTTTVLPSTAVFFHGTYRGAKSVVPVVHSQGGCTSTEYRFHCFLVSNFISVTSGTENAAGINVFD